MRAVESGPGGQAELGAQTTANVNKRKNESLSRFIEPCAREYKFCSIIVALGSAFPDRRSAVLVTLIVR